MKDKILSFAGMGIKGRSSSDPLITHLSPTNHPLLQKAWKYTTCMLLALLLGVGNMWGEAVVPSQTWTVGNTTQLSEWGWSDKGQQNSIYQSGDTIAFSAYLAYQSVGKQLWMGYNVKGGSSNGSTAWEKSKGFGGGAHYFDGTYYWATTNNKDPRDYQFQVTNCEAVYIYCNASSNGRNVDLKAYEIVSGTVSTTAAKSAQYSATTNGSVGITGLDKTKTYRISVKGDNKSNCVFYEIAFVAPATISTYTVTINPDGGTTSTEGWTLTDGNYVKSGIAKDASVTLPTMTKDDNDFVGWKDNHDNEIASPITITKDTILVAQWVSSATPTHAISYKTESLKGADVSGYPTEYYEGTGIASFDALDDVENFHFNGWNPPSIGADATTNIEVSATWVPSYNVTFSAGAGSGNVPATFQKWEGAKFELPGQGSMVAPSGKAFDGWKAGTTKYAAGAEYTMGNTAVEFVAQWKAVPQTIYSLTVTNSSNVNLANGGTQNDLADDATIVGGGAYMQNDHASKEQQILASTKLQFKAGTVTLVMTFNTALQEGDTIKATGLNQEGLCFGTVLDREASLDNQLASDASEFIVPAAFEGATTLYAWRHAGSGTTCASIKVIRPAARDIASTVITLSDVKVNDVSISAANLTTLTTAPAYKVALADEFAEAPVIKFNEHTVITYTEGEPATKTTDKVYTVTATVNGDGKWQAQQTINEVAYTVTAEKVSAYTVTYKDGEIVLGTEIVAVGSHPSASEISTTKPLFAFAAWQLSGSDVALGDVTGAANEEIVLVARWDKVYATSVNLKEAATGSDAYGDVLDAHNIAYELTNTGWDDGTDIYNGLKIKGVNSYISFNLKQGQFLILTVGYATNDVRIDVDGVNQSFVSSTTALSTFNYYAESADAVIKVTKTATNGTASSIRDIFISDPYVVTYDAETNGGDAVAPATFTGTALVLPAAAKTGENFLGWFDAATEGTKIGEAGDEYTPAGTVTLFAQFEAVSTDARLSAITFSSDAGTLVPAFDPDVTEYTYTMPYGTASIPTITGAMAVNANAQARVIGEGATAWGGTQTITGVAQSGAEKTYTITMLVAPKDGVCIIKATLSGASGKAATCTVTGLIGGTASVNLSNMKSDGGAKLDDGKSFGITLAEGTFQENDIVNVHITTAAGQGRFAVWADDACTSLITDAGVVGVVGDNKLTLSSAANGKSTIYLARADAVNSWNPQLNVFEVYRAMNPLLKTLSINGKDADVSTTAVSMELATGTDLSNLAIVETYISNDNSQVTTAVISNSGNWVEGENTYRVTDKDGDYTDYTITISLVTPAVDPTIETDLAASGTYEEYSSAALSIVASSSDGGTLSYQWYKDDVAIEGAVEASYNVSEEGTYKVIVKNSLSATNYATATSTACAMTVVMPSGCDELASIPSAEPYQYVQTGEWTLYSITSNGKLNSSTKFKNNAKNFADANVNAISDQRFALKFEKNVEHVDFYATASSPRTWNGNKTIQVTEDDIAGETVAYTDVTAGFTTDLTTIVDNGGGTRQYIFRATGIFEAGKTYWFAFNGGLDVFRICYAEALEKPVLPPLSDEDICEGGSFSEMSVASASVSEGTLSYQWYKDDEAIVGSEAATYQPTSAGTYYVVVTNSLLGRQPISAESNHAELTASTSAVITTAPKDVRDDADKPATLTVVAVGKNLHYAWKECATIDGTYTDVAGAADAASLDVTVPDGVKYYKVVVSSDCGGDVEAIAKVEKWVELSQVSVSESTVWDWATIGNAINATVAPEKNVEKLMANIKDGEKTIVNDASFNSQALLFYGQEALINDGSRWFAKGGYISFNTTVPGVVTVEFSDNGSNNRRLSINGKLSEPSTAKGDVKSFMAIVPAGEVKLMGVNNDGSGSNQYIRISKIEFMKVDYTRDVTVGRLGTICLPNGGKMYGADLYEVAYFDASAKKIFFDEILSGEMEAGVPYVFLPNGKLDKLAVAYTDEVEALAGNKNGLYGSYTQEALATDGTNYILINNQYCRVVEANTYVGANRAYLKIGVAGGVPTNAVAPAPGRRRISMGVQSEQVATGIGDVQGDEVQSSKVLINGQLFILRGEKMYDATGRLVK